MRLFIGLSSVLTQWPICQFIVYRNPAREGQSGSLILIHSPAEEKKEKKLKKKRPTQKVSINVLRCGCCQEQKDPLFKCSTPIWLANAQKVAEGGLPGAYPVLLFSLPT